MKLIFDHKARASNNHIIRVPTIISKCDDGYNVAVLINWIWSNDTGENCVKRLINDRHANFCIENDTNRYVNSILHTTSTHYLTCLPVGG